MFIAGIAQYLGHNPVCLLTYPYESLIKVIYLFLISSYKFLAIIQCKGSKPQRLTSHSAKKLTRKSKVKTKAKPKKSKEQEQTDVAGVVVSQVTTPYENISRDGVDKVVNLFNETLRWNCVCSDSEDEAERLKTYKENRRKRYAEAMQVKVMQRMTVTS